MPHTRERCAATTQQTAPHTEGAEVSAMVAACNHMQLQGHRGATRGWCAAQRKGPAVGRRRTKEEEQEEEETKRRRRGDEEETKKKRRRRDEEETKKKRQTTYGRDEEEETKKKRRRRRDEEEGTKKLIDARARKKVDKLKFQN